VATGDGMAMALRAGAALLDMEFVQFHPTALRFPGAPRFLISEAVRGEGAYLIGLKGERFTEELGPRDQVARAIVREVRAHGGPVRLDLRHLDAERVRRRFPRIVSTCLRYGLDVPREPIPVTPAAHYVMGGVATDLEARSTLPGLYAAGECASTGVHGANRLASNSLLEGLVFGARAADAMVEDRGLAGSAPTAPQAPTLALPPEELRRRAWEALGLERDAVSLEGLLEELHRARMAPAVVESRAEAEARNLTDVAWAMAVSALFREESRGAHYRRDFPETDDARFRGHTLLDAAGPRLVPVDRPLEKTA
jgi:L-aspartate oxidase